MRRVKKATALTLAAAMVFSLAGCGRNAGNQTGKAQEAAAGSGGNAAGSLEAGSGQVTIKMFFAAISGSAVATVSAVGAFMIPEMVSHGYNKPFSAALTAAAGTIGVIIPPSIPFVIYGVVSGTSITELFTAGFLPGIMMGIALMVVCYFVSKKNGYRGKEKASSPAEIWKTFKDAFWAILSPVIILGGIYSGFFTEDSEAIAGSYRGTASDYLYSGIYNDFLK